MKKDQISNPTAINSKGKRKRKAICSSKTPHKSETLTSIKPKPIKCLQETYSYPVSVSTRIFSDPKNPLNLM